MGGTHGGEAERQCQVLTLLRCHAVGTGMRAAWRYRWGRIGKARRFRTHLSKLPRHRERAERGPALGVVKKGGGPAVE